jgi:cytochrome c oxidase accessory protein FixG
MSDTNGGQGNGTSPKVVEIHPQKDARTESLYEIRQKVYPRAVSGYFANWRWALVWITQIVFYGMCWLPWNGRQAVLFELATRKFYIFGWVFWPQDVFYLSVLLIICAYSLFLFTAVAGRLWCGYACPQTVYTEIFIWVEKIIEGDRARRMKLDASSASVRKFGIKFAKYAAWVAISLWTGLTFVGYFTPVSELLGNIARFRLSGWETFWVVFYGGFTYLMAGVMREQVCKYMCPYARFQGVMFDPDTLVITYDQLRGEPRGAHRKNAEAGKLGDCVDCGICVQVCPTGIDIRNGLQYECIGCSACIDACDQVMDKVGSPRGLIRYSTENAVQKQWKREDILRHILRPRILIYTAVLCAICVAFVWALATRQPLRMDVIKDRSVLVREVEGGLLENVYVLKVMNMAEKPRALRLSVSGLDGITLDGPTQIEVNPAENKTLTVRVRVPMDTAGKGTHKVYFDVVAVDDANLQLHEKAVFLVR